MKKILYILATLIVATSCSNEEIPQQEQQGQVPINILAANIISLSTKAEGGTFAQGSNIGLVQKKATGKYDVYQSKFYRFDKFSSYDSNSYSQTNPVIWTPGCLDHCIYASSKTDVLVAFSPIDWAKKDPYQTGIATFKPMQYNPATVYYNNSDSEDYIVTDEVSYNNMNPNLNLNLKHINTLFEFHFSKASGYTPTEGQDRISKIKMAGDGINGKRKYNTSTFTWEDAGTGSTIGYFELAINNAYLNQYTSGKSYTEVFVLAQPANITSSLNYYAEFTVGPSIYKINLPIDVLPAFEPNKKYIVEVEFNLRQAVVKTISITNWTEKNITNGTPIVTVPYY